MANRSGQIAQFKAAMEALEAQRSILGDIAVDSALAGMRKTLAELEGNAIPLSQSPDQTDSLTGAPAARTPAAGERKFVTIMFADISGFTALSEKMDPEAVRDLMNACFDDLVPVIKQYSGTVDKFIGDEIMAIFGDGLPHERRLGKMYRIR